MIVGDEEIPISFNIPFKFSGPLKDYINNNANAIQYIDRKHILDLSGFDKNDILFDFIRTGSVFKDITVAAKESIEKTIDSITKNTTCNMAYVLATSYALSNSKLSDNTVIGVPYRSKYADRSPVYSTPKGSSISIASWLPGGNVVSRLNTTETYSDDEVKEFDSGAIKDDTFVSGNRRYHTKSLRKPIKG